MSGLQAPLTSELHKHDAKRNDSLIPNMQMQEADLSPHCQMLFPPIGSMHFAVLHAWHSHTAYCFDHFCKALSPADT